MGMYGKHLGSDNKLKIRAGTDIDCSIEPSLTRQAEKDAADINKIIARFEKNGMVDHLAKGEPFYGDVSQLTDYHTHLSVVREAEDLFYKMDARIREKFENDPGKLIAFLDNEDNYLEAVELGMVIKRPEEVVEGDVTPVLAPPEKVSVRTI